MARFSALGRVENYEQSQREAAPKGGAGFKSLLLF